MDKIVTLADLKPDPKNARKHSPKNIELITTSLQQVGAARSGVADEDMELLLVALEARDRSEQARLAIATEGLTSTNESTGAVHLHPLVRVERESKQLFSKIMQQLGLSFRNNSW